MNLGKTLAAAASTGLMFGALSGCGGHKPPPETPDGHHPAAAGEGAHGDAHQAADKACCKGKHKCKGKGACGVEGKNSCAGKNDCKGQGGCNMHCPE